MNAAIEKILIVDDDKTLIRTLTWILKGEGFEVHSLEDGDGVIRTLHQIRPDLLLLDIMMPNVDGLQLLKEIKESEDWASLPVLMISSMPPEDATVKSLGLGAADYIAKPFRVRELVARVRAHLKASKDLHDAREQAKTQAEMVDILSEVTESLKTDEIYHILARRVARVLKLSKCSMVLAKADDKTGVVVAAYDNPMLRNLQIPLEHYPEIRRALTTGELVLVEDVGVDPLYADERARWERDGLEVPTRSCIAIPFSMRSEQVGVFFLRTLGDDPSLTKADSEFAQAVINAAVGAIEKAHDLESAVRDKDRLEKLASTDSLTGCLNRRVMLERLTSELERARRYNLVLSVLMIDLDRFKGINDTHGHLVGDSVLSQIGALFRREVRSADSVARYGGEEFVIVMPETALEGATVFADRLRERIAKHNFGESGAVSLPLTISIGVSGFPDARITSAESFIALGDQALYQAKRDGRNLVRVQQS